MTRIIIILICALGIAYYTVQIYSLKDTISLTRSAPETKSSAKPVAKQTAQPKMQFQFTMESTDVDLIEGCRQLFRDDDKLQLQVDFVKVSVWSEVIMSFPLGIFYYK